MDREADLHALAQALRLGVEEAPEDVAEPPSCEALALAELLASRAAEPEVAPSPSLRARVLAATRPETALDGFAERVAQLLDWMPERAHALLREAARDDRASWLAGPAPGIQIRPLEAGPRHGQAVAGLVWCDPGSVFPAHSHRGPEWALVLKGGAVNSGGEHWTVGDLVYQPRGSTHSFAIPRGGSPLLAAVVVRRGLELV